MISYDIYKFIHISSMIIAVFALAMVLVSFNSGAPRSRIKILGFELHGIGLAGVVVSGFGMLARLGLVTGLPTWVYAKIGLWVFLGIAISLAKRKASSPLMVSTLILSAVITAVYIARFKPF